MTRHVVAAVAAIPDGGRLKVDIDGRAIVVFNVGGAFYALADRCPHQGGPLSKGDQIGELSASGAGRHVYCRRKMTIRCPWHHWEFDIETGRSRIDPSRVKIRSYETVVDDNSVCGDGAALEATTYETASEEGILYVIL